MKVNRIIIRTMFLSAFIIGLAGALKVSGSSASHMFALGITGGVGWTAIIVAYLAKLHPLRIAVVALLLSILERGCELAASAFGVSPAASDIIQSIVLFSVLAFDFFAAYKLTLRDGKLKDFLNKIKNVFKKKRKPETEGEEQ
jgi:simple sugar transport system permease protein